MTFKTRFAIVLAAVTLAAFRADRNPPTNTASTQPTTYPIVDDSFLSAVDWRFIGPYRGGRVLAVAGVISNCAA